MTAKVRTAVFPVAGRGTRFLPATKSSPKEMLAVVDKPLIQYAVEEALAAGATRLVFVTGGSKRAIEDHFDVDRELEDALEQSGKTDLLKLIRDIVPPSAACIYVRQGEPLGLGHAVLCARPVVGNEPFFVHLADDLIDAGQPVLAQMRAQYEACGHSILGVETIDIAHSASYGIVAAEQGADGRRLVSRIVEKPKPDEAPSNLAVVGRYLLTPAIFDRLERTGCGAGGEIQLTDAIADLLADERVVAYPFEGRRYDCGNKLGYLQATVELALKHETLGDEFRAWLREHPV